MKEFLKEASKLYYEGTPIILDSVFDRLAERESFEEVGYDLKEGIEHHYPMYSLKKAYVGDSMPKLKNPIETPKLDGSAVSILYIYGKLQLALTRGDGKKGLDVTDKVCTLVPQTLGLKAPKVLQVVGEIVASKNLQNSRNYASGSLMLKDLKEFKKRAPKLTFIAYGLSPYINEFYTEDMEWLLNNSFKTVYHSNLNEFPKDGKVFRENNNSTFEKLGYTSSHPRGAYALKERLEGEITVLEDVIWQVGRSGVVSPVAILKPINIKGATVSKATLHNKRYIEELGLELGCLVEVVRSGEIIPRIVRKIDE